MSEKKSEEETESSNGKKGRSIASRMAHRKLNTALIVSCGTHRAQKRNSISIILTLPHRPIGK